jgi:hypothetical protein
MRLFLAAPPRERRASHVVASHGTLAAHPQLGGQRKASMKMRIGLLALVTATDACVAAALHVAAPSKATTVQAARRCGADRWYVRTLQDRPVLLPARRTTIRELVRIPRPKTLPATRLAIEHRVVTVIALAGTATPPSRRRRRPLLDPEQRLGGAYGGCHAPPVLQQPRQRGDAAEDGRGSRHLPETSVRYPGDDHGVLFFTSKRDSTDFRSARSGIELRPVLAFTCPYN